MFEIMPNQKYTEVFYTQNKIKFTFKVINNIDDNSYICEYDDGELKILDRDFIFNKCELVVDIGINKNLLPVIDWTKAPAGTEAHCFWRDGSGNWFSSKNTKIEYFSGCPMFVTSKLDQKFSNGFSTSASDYKIDPLQIDWTKTFEINPLIDGTN